MKTTRFADRLDKTEPGLIVRNGNTARKHISLQRSGVTLGRARGCDIQLEAPDVSALHCVITRGTAGVFIRDCGSRHGTKVNGVKVDEAPLHATDVIQIGSFSFEVYLPWTETPRDPNQATLEVCKNRLARVEKSRERLAGLAIHLRKRYHEERVARAQAMVDTWPVPPRQRDKQTQTGDQVQREAELAQREKALGERQLQLDQQAAELERQRQQLQQARPGSTRPAASTQFAMRLGETERDMVMSTLQQRRQELEEYAGKLREAYEHLTAQEKQLRELAAAVQRDQQQLAEARTELAGDREQIEILRAALLAQRDELECKQAELEARANQHSEVQPNGDQSHLEDIVHLVRDLCTQARRRHESEALAFREMCEQLANLAK